MLATLRPVKGFRASEFISGWVNVFKMLVLYFTHLKTFDPLMFRYYIFSSDLWIAAVWYVAMSTSCCHVRKGSWTLTKLLWEAITSVCLKTYNKIRTISLTSYRTYDTHKFEVIHMFCRTEYTVMEDLECIVRWSVLKRQELFCTIARGTKPPSHSLSTYAFVMPAAYLTGIPA